MSKTVLYLFHLCKCSLFVFLLFVIFCSQLDFCNKIYKLHVKYVKFEDTPLRGYFHACEC
jgi:hypothetical protein